MKFPDAQLPLRILLADDHEIFRLGTATFLKTHLGCDICAEAADGREALRLAETTRPDVAVIDLGLPGLNGMDLTKQVRRRFPQTEVVILSGQDDPEVAQRALEAGARAFILKVDAIGHLPEAIRSAAQHHYYLTTETYASLQRDKPLKPDLRQSASTPKLTERQREVVQLLAEGKSNKEVASILGISVKTSQTHRSTIMRRLKLARPSDLVRYAIHHKIIVA